MYPIDEFFSQDTGDFPKAGVRGVETDWMHLCDFVAPHGRLWAGDPWVADEEDGFATDMPPGNYRVSIKGMDFNGPRRISRLQLQLESADTPTLGEACGTTYTDVAQIGVCDMKAMGAAVPPEKADDYMEDITSIDDGLGLITFEYGGPSFDMLLVSSGLGDGEFAVYPLEEQGQRVGLEIEFLPPDFELEEDIPMIGGADGD